MASRCCRDARSPKKVAPSNNQGVKAKRILNGWNLKGGEYYKSKKIMDRVTIAREYYYRSQFISCQLLRSFYTVIRGRRYNSILWLFLQFVRIHCETHEWKIIPAVNARINKIKRLIWKPIIFNIEFKLMKKNFLNTKITFFKVNYFNVSAHSHHVKILWSLKSERGLHYKRNGFPRFQTLIDYTVICQKLGEDIRIPKLPAAVFWLSTGIT